MTMIRINLIAERKAGSPKVAKKPTGQASELQENMILIVSCILALVVFFFMHRMVQNDLNAKLSEKKKLEAVWEKNKHWKDKKEKYEIQKELLNEKIERISELKDRRQGPVKLMEDVANVLPDSVWLESVSQGYQASLLTPTDSGRAKHSMPKSIGSENLVRVQGYANSQEAITNFANQILSMDKRYSKTDLNHIEVVENDEGRQEYGFSIFFEIKKSGEPNPEDDAEKSGVN